MTAYSIEVCRKRHRRGYAYDEHTVRRSDGKVIAKVNDPVLAERIKARFEHWGRQGWKSTV